jgi:hypothetical protein
MKNKIEDLRNHLFATLEALQDKDAPMDLDRARAVAEVANVLVESAKAEVLFLKTTDNVQGSGFFPEDMKTVQGTGQARLGRDA